MTLIASWIGIDSRGPSSIYIMSDSRISWGEKGHYDFGKKIFGCKNHPDILGYCGDVLFPTMVLSQIVDIADEGLLFGADFTCEQKSQAIIDKLIETFEHYPSEVEGIADDSLRIIHCCRDSTNNFYCKTIRWLKKTNKWTIEPIPLTQHSDKLIVVGSGAPDFLRKYKLYWESANKKTSRALFHCFHDTLSNINVASVGGPPQLAGLYRIKNAIFHGIIYNEKRYFQGVNVDNLSNFENVEWRNELFEVCDGNTKMRKKNAKAQPNPLINKEATPRAAPNL
jgi:hypothetical protein